MPSTAIESATVKTVHLTKDEQARASKAKESEKRLARNSVIANAEASATAFEDAFAKLCTINQQGATLYQSFKEIAEASREPFTIVRHFFAHKKEGELLFGEYATGDAWAQARCGVSYGYVCRCLNPPKEQPLLKAVNETAQSPVSSKPSPHVVELQALLADNTTKAVREQINKKVDKEIADAKKANAVETKVLLAKQAAEMKSSVAKHVAKLKVDTENQRKQDEQEAKRQQQIAVQRAVDATQANALKPADKLPKKTTTAQEAIALDEAILILQGLIFNIPKSAFKEKKYFRQAVAFLKSHNAFQAPVGGAA
jgi:hypothetical protein